MWHQYSFRFKTRLMQHKLCPISIFQLSCNWHNLIFRSQGRRGGGGISAAYTVSELSIALVKNLIPTRCTPDVYTRYVYQMWCTPDVVYTRCVYAVSQRH